MEVRPCPILRRLPAKKPALAEAVGTIGIVLGVIIFIDKLDDMLPNGAVEMLGDDVSHVQLAYNAKKGLVGIRGADEGAQGRYRLRSQKNGTSRLVTGKRFFSHYGLTIEKARTFDAEAYDGGIVGFCLTEEPAEVALAKKAPAKKTAGRRKARAAS